MEVIFKSIFDYIWEIHIYFHTDKNLHKQIYFKF